MPSTTGICVTTIFAPEFLAGYVANLKQSGHGASTTIFVIPDKKTPATVAQAAEVARAQGVQVRCPGLDEQDAFVKRLGLPDDFIPYNTDNRRNIGFLMALEQGCEVLISIDDDNYCLPNQDFVGEHHAVGSECKTRVVQSSDGWFNICELLDTRCQGSGVRGQGEEAESGEGRGRSGEAGNGESRVESPEQGARSEIFPRGFPYFAQRIERRIGYRDVTEGIPIAMNAGLWLDDPDVDAVFRLCQKPKVTAASSEHAILGPDVWSPLNTQNTALTRQAALTYYYVKMGYPLKGLSIDRFGDILSGYLTQKCAKHLGHAVRIGSPVVEHRRTPHNLFKDLYHELAGIVLIEDFLPWLIEEPLEGTTYLDAYASLAERMASAASDFNGFIWDEGGREFLQETARCMQTWADAVRRWE